jgi:hypothetical protein
MSRSLTAAQVITQGDYLEPDFDPSTLTVNQLLGVFGFHNIRYPTPYTKPKLVQLFHDEISTKTKAYKKERVKAEASAASDVDIKDGVTGELINPPKVRAMLGNHACDSKLLNLYYQPLRRSSRHSSRAPSVDTEVKAEPVSHSTRHAAKISGQCNTSIVIS